MVTRTPPPPSVKEPPKPQPTIKLDPSLLVPPQDFADYISAAEKPSSHIIPISSPYWSKSSKTIILEPQPATKIADGIGSVIRLEWSADGRRIICAARNRILVVDVESRKALTIFSADRIEGVSISPDRTAVAASVGNRLYAVSIEGERLGLYTFKSRVRSVTWSPDSRRLACSTRNVVWIADRNGPIRELTTHRYIKDAYGDPPVWREVIDIDSLSWSPTGYQRSPPSTGEGIYNPGEAGEEPLLQVQTGPRRAVRG